MKIIKSDMDLTTSGNNLFEKGNSKRLGKKENEEFHTSATRVMFVVNRVRTDIHKMVAVLSKSFK